MEEDITCKMKLRDNIYIYIYIAQIHNINYKNKKLKKIIIKKKNT